MRILYCICIILICTNAHSQTQEREDKVKIKKSVERLQYLNATRQISQHIYTYSLCWVYIPEPKSQQELRSLLYIEIPTLKEQKYSLKNQGITTAVIDSSTIYIDSLASLTIKNIQSLLTFEDYYDSTDRLTVNFKNAEINLNDKIIPLYRKFIEQLNESIETEKALISNILLTNKHNQSKLNVSGIGENYQELIDKMENRELYWRLYPEAINLVYRAADSTARKIIKSGLQIEPKVSFSEELEVQVKNETFLNAFHKFQTEIFNLNSLLVQQSDYDDMLTILLSQEKIDSEISLVVWEMESVLKEGVENDFEKLKISIFEDSDKKKSDIKKILEYNFATLELLTSESNKSNPKFDMEDFLDQMIQVYSKRFTHDEIKEILKFQNSKIGKKIQKNSIDMLLETMEITQQYFKELSNEK